MSTRSLMPLQQLCSPPNCGRGKTVSGWNYSLPARFSSSLRHRRQDPVASPPSLGTGQFLPMSLCSEGIPIRSQYQGNLKINKKQTQNILSNNKKNKQNHTNFHTLHPSFSKMGNESDQNPRVLGQPSRACSSVPNISALGSWQGGVLISHYSFLPLQRFSMEILSLI